MVIFTVLDNKSVFMSVEWYHTEWYHTYN